MSVGDGPLGERVARLEGRMDATDKHLEGSERRSGEDRDKLWKADEDKDNRLSKIERFMAGLVVLQVLGLVIYTAIIGALVEHFQNLVGKP